MLRQFINGFVAATTVCIAFGMGSGAAWSNVVGPLAAQPHMTRADFDQAFADAVAASRSRNTPANREKLRNMGWRYLNVPLASK